MDLMPFTDALPTNAPAHVFYSDPSVATPLSERFPIDNSLANVLPVAGPDRLQSLASMSPLPRSVSSVLGLLVRASQEQKMGHDLQADRLSSHVARGWKCSLPGCSLEQARSGLARHRSGARLPSPCAACVFCGATLKRRYCQQPSELPSKPLQAAWAGRSDRFHPQGRKHTRRTIL